MCTICFPKLLLTAVLMGLAGAPSAAWTTGEECPLLDDRGYGDHFLVHGDVLVPPEYFAEAAFRPTLWEAGLVRYFVEDSVGASQLQSIESAMAQWESVANVDFARWYAHSAPHVHIRQADANEDNFSGVGQGVYDIGITDWSHHDVLLHELGHCLGYWHEQSRPDRDAYVRILWHNIKPGEEHNFDIESSASSRAPYDFDSIMHYPACLFSVWGSCSGGAPPLPPTPWAWTIEALSPHEAEQSTMGSATDLSILDKAVMSYLYPEPGWRFVDTSSTAPVLDGTFLRPYRDLASGLSGVPTGGKLWLAPGEYQAAGLYDKPMVLSSQFNDVILR